MTAFTQGMQLGMKAWNDAEAAKRQKVLDDRATEEYNRKKSLWQEEDAAFANLNTVQSGVSPETQQQIKATYGMTPQQIAQAGGAEGLKQKLASYDVPDSSDLQSVPATGLQPRFDASQLKIAAPTELEREKALERVAIAQRNVAGIRDSVAAQRGFRKDEVFSKAMQAPLAEIESAIPKTNRSGIPILYTDKTKDGWTFVKTEGDGVTPIPGSAFTLNEAQIRNLYAADALASAGFGTDAMTLLNSTHKDIGDHIGKWNEFQTKTATTNNDATYKQGNLKVEERKADTDARYKDGMISLYRDGLKGPGAKGGAGSKPVKMSVPVKDQTTGKITRMDVIRGEDGKFYDASGKEVSGVLDSTGDTNPEIATLTAMRQRVLGTLTPDNYTTARQSLDDIDKNIQLAQVKHAISVMPTDERPGFIQKQLATGADKSTLVNLGFSLDEIRAAKATTPGSAQPTTKPGGGLAPKNSPIAKAEARRAEQARLAEEKGESNRKALEEARGISRRTMSTLPSDRFEVDRQTMSPAGLRRAYGNGRGLTDEQYQFMMSN